jgi:hypothetical protein
LHVKKGFWLAFEPALELAVEESEEAQEAEREAKAKAKAIFRIGTGYDFELGKFSIAPNLSIDVSNEKPSWLWGINIGRAFGSAGEAPAPESTMRVPPYSSAGRRRP